jgi:hypothetical protein
MLHAGRINGFLLNKQLIYRASLTTGDYPAQMHVTNCKKWTGWYPKTHFSLPRQSVFFFLANALHFCLHVDEPQPSYPIQTDMISWLPKKVSVYYDTMGT